ncbi:MAG TPA: MFS transporter [Micromonosporaceae bacterium]|nr:MFS transporter [Micromonosporaceae bacterium]
MTTSPWLRLLRIRGFSLLWTAGLISMTGDWLLRVALPIYVYQLSDSAGATAAAVAARVGMGMLAAPLAGVLVDRWDRKRVMVIANLAQAITLLPLLAVDSAGELWIAYLVIAAQCVCAVFVAPAEHALLPRLVPQADLAAANGLNALNNNIARLLGPALGGIVAVTLGITGAVLLNSVTFLLAGVLSGLIAGAHRAESTSRRHMLGELADGARVVAGSRVLRALFAVLAVTSLGEGIMGSLFPVFVVDALHGGVEQVAWLMSAQAVGGIVGGLACAAVARRLSPSRMVVAGLIAFGTIDLMIFNYPRWFAEFGPVVVLFVLVGVPGAIATAAYFTLLQTEVPDELRARVFSGLILLEGGAGLVGAALAATLTGRFGVINVLTAQGAAYVLSALAFVLVLRRNRSAAPIPATTSRPLAMKGES